MDSQNHCIVEEHGLPQAILRVHEFVGRGKSYGLQPNSDSLQPKSDGFQPKSDGLQPKSDSLPTLGSLSGLWVEPFQALQPSYDGSGRDPRQEPPGVEFSSRSVRTLCSVEAIASRLATNKKLGTKGIATSSREATSSFWVS